MTTTVTEVSALPVGERIVWARKRKGISQEKLAALIGTSRRHMIRIEKGYNQPGQTFLARIAEATGQPQDLFAADIQEAARAGEPFRGSAGHPRGGADGAAEAARAGKVDVTEDAA